MAQKAKAIVINEKDNVATALTSLKPGTTVKLERGGRPVKIRSLASIPMGHKFALQEIGRGEDVVKYGEPIGEATAPISPGEHVHIHNVVGHRGRKEAGR